MSYAVSITASGGMLRVAVTGEPSGNNFTRSYKPQAVCLHRMDGSSFASLVEVESGQAICSFAYADVTAPSLGLAGTIDALYTAIEALLGAGDTLPSGAATAAKQDIQLVLLEEILGGVSRIPVYGGDLTVGGSPSTPVSENSASDNFAVDGAKVITAQVVVSATVGVLPHTVRLEGTIDGNQWTVLDSAVGVGDGAIQLTYNCGTTGGVYEFARVWLASTGTGELLGRVIAVN